MPASTAPIAWIDVETDSLDHQTGDLLEIAAIVTTGPDYTPVDEGISLTIHPARYSDLTPEDAVGQVKLDLKEAGNQVVLDMHTNNGLFADIAAGRCVSLEEADLAVRDYLAQHFTPQGAILGGNSITLDRNFMSTHTPNTYGMLHYRSIDCTSVYELVRRLPWVGNRFILEPELQGTAHRALGDALTSVAQARLLSQLLSAPESTRTPPSTAAV